MEAPIKGIVDDFGEKLEFSITDKERLVFIKGPKSIDVLSAAERLEEIGYTMIQGINNIIVPTDNGYYNLYTATLRSTR